MPRSGISLCLGLVLLLLAAVNPRAEAAPANSKPNIVVIMVDDFGYECVGANGGESYRTPVLDQLAATGVRFDHCYVQPLCTPTRVQLMTGVYNVRNYVQFGLMDPKLYTFGHLLKQNGYATCVVGKWQLGHDRELPKQFGFDESYLWQHTRRPERYKNPGLEINGVEKDWNNGEYGPELVNQYALDFISRKKDAPFFLYYPMILTHSPFVATPDSPDYHQAETEKSKSEKAKSQKKARENPQQRHFADMVAYTDKMVGRLIARLDELGIRENTLLLFLGDNGTGQGIRSTLNGRELLGGKGMMTHRGMHVPLIAHWPARMQGRGRVCSDLVDSTDFFPTIAEAAGIRLPDGIDGRSFCPQLCGETGQPRQWYYCWYAPRELLEGEFTANHQYKLYRDGRFYNLRQDPEEQRPLAADTLTAEAAQAKATLQHALDQFRDARPAHLPQPTRRQKKKAA